MTIIIRPFDSDEGDGYSCTPGGVACWADATWFVGLPNTKVWQGWLGHAACDDPEHRRLAIEFAQSEYADRRTHHNEDKQAKYEPQGVDCDQACLDAWGMEAAAYYDYEPSPYDGTYSED